MPGTGLLALIVVLLIILALYLFLVKRVVKRWSQQKEESVDLQGIVYLFGAPSPLLSWLRKSSFFQIAANLVNAIKSGFARLWAQDKNAFHSPVEAKSRPPQIGLIEDELSAAHSKIAGQPTQSITSFSQSKEAAWLEIGLVIAWAIWVGQDYLNFTPLLMVGGNEYPMEIQSHFVWSLLPKCASCVFWNGSINGGYPAFAETLGSILHPLVIITTLIWGVINGSKVLIVASLATAGLALWWLARVMGLGWIARLWVAAMAVVGGNLASRMSDGGYQLVLSQASASLIFAPAVELYLTRQRKSAVLLGIALALTWVSGGGYIQIAIVMVFITTFWVLMVDNHFHLQPVWKDFALAVILSVLLAGIFWVPLLHYLPNFIKDGDPYLTNLQPLEYMPLNLVIRDMDFFRIKILGHDLNMYTNVIFIGWIPVLLAILSLRFAPRHTSRLQAFFWLSIGVVFLICSQDLNQLLIRRFEQIGSLRSMSAASGLAVPLVLALAALGLDSILHSDAPKIGFFSSSGIRVGLGINWIIGAVVMFIGLSQAYNLSKPWLVNTLVDPPRELVKAMTPSQAEWISPPFGEYPWIPILLGQGVKLTQVFQPWHWRDRTAPIPYIEAIRDPDGTQTMTSLGNIDGVELYRHADGEYTFIQTNGKDIPCKASAAGGNIDVTCTSGAEGQLIVKENSWTGWLAWIDSRLTPLEKNQWLSVPALVGTHHYSFRYWPIDVMVGMLVTLSGWLLAIWMSFSRTTKTENPGASLANMAVLETPLAEQPKN
jgi:hypothetical protein